jgi:hypothetical protein
MVSQLYLLCAFTEFKQRAVELVTVEQIVVARREHRGGAAATAAD